MATSTDQFDDDTPLTSPPISTAVCRPKSPPDMCRAVKAFNQLPAALLAEDPRTAGDNVSCSLRARTRPREP
jgi:hypothetical protein